MIAPSSSTLSNPPELSVDYTDVAAAAERLNGVAHCTPVLTSRTVDAQTRGQVFFKAENFQRTGSFKFRGAYNAIAQLTPEQKQRGVATYSSGNHAQAVALAGKLLKIPVHVAMPMDAPDVKRHATEDYGATLHLYDRATTDRETFAQELAAQHQLTLIPPYNHPQVIAGQGTAAKELFEAVGDLDYLLVCCGGGGLLSGCAIAAHHLSPNCRVIGVEPSTADDATRSFHSKTLQTVHNPDTIADGARTASLGTLTFPLVLHYVYDMMAVPDRALCNTLVFLLERLKIVVEPTGALAATALLSDIFQPPPDARIGVILSGGNIDRSLIATL
ncbi:MAG: threo-3-hydroxy-L-aspartate ammonia-lyase [Cyanobacteria bacterium J06638_22]